MLRRSPANRRHRQVWALRGQRKRAGRVAGLAVHTGRAGKSYPSSLLNRRRHSRERHSYPAAQLAPAWALLLRLRRSRCFVCRASLHYRDAVSFVLAVPTALVFAGLPRHRAAPTTCALLKSLSRRALFPLTYKTPFPRAGTIAYRHEAGFTFTLFLISDQNAARIKFRYERRESQESSTG